MREKAYLLVDDLVDQDLAKPSDICQKGERGQMESVRSSESSEASRARLTLDGEPPPTETIPSEESVGDHHRVDGAVVRHSLLGRGLRREAEREGIRTGCRADGHEREERAYNGIVPPDPVLVVVGRVVRVAVSVLGSDEVSNHLNREEDDESSEGGGGEGQVGTDLEVFIGTSDTRRIVELASLGSLAKARDDAVPVGVCGLRSFGDEEDDRLHVPQGGQRLRPVKGKCQHRGAPDEEMAAAYRRMPGCAVPPFSLLDNPSDHLIVGRRDDDRLRALVLLTLDLTQDVRVALDDVVVHAVLPLEGGQMLDGQPVELVLLVVGPEEVVDL